MAIHRLIDHPLSLRARRVRSLVVSANLILSGDSPADPRETGELVLDLLDAAAELTERIVDDQDALEERALTPG